MATKKAPQGRTATKKPAGGTKPASATKKPTSAPARGGVPKKRDPAKAKPATPAKPRPRSAPPAKTKEKNETKKNDKRLEDRIRQTKEILAHYTAPGPTGRCHTIASCCTEEGVAERTFRKWVQDHAEIAELYKKAKSEHSKLFKDGLRERAQNALERLVEGFDYVETKTEAMQLLDRRGRPTLDEHGKPIVVVTKTVKTTKHVAPNPTAVIFALKNADPEEFKDKHEIVPGEGGPDTPLQVFRIGDQLFQF